MSAPTDAGGRIWSNIGGIVDRMLGSTPRPWTGGGGNFKVNKDNVLHVAKLVHDAASQLRKKVDERANQMRTGPAMGDPVSADVAKVFNHKLVEADDSYINRAYQYVQNWYDTVDELKKVAHSYGYTEEDITKALQGPASISLPSAEAGSQLAAGWIANLKGPLGA